MKNDKPLPYYLANRPVAAGPLLDVKNKYTGAVAAQVHMADAKAIDEAIAKCDAAAPAMAAMPAYKRQEVLLQCVSEFTARAEELAQALCVEAGKPIKDSRGEVARLIETFKIAAEETVRIEGEVMPLDRSARTKDYTCFIKRVPVGPCSLITPFNFPLNLVAHKVAPALAAGCPFVLKPASSTPLGALIVGDVLSRTGLPEGAFSILPCDHRDAAPFSEDDRIKLLSFTGSPEVGWGLKARSGKKKVVLELGGNAACVVDAGTDVADAVGRVIFGAYYQSGQSCISVQRILVHRSLYTEFRDKLAAATRALKCGDPANEDTFIGPVISEKEAVRMSEWIEEAVARGAKLLAGGKRQGALLEPTLLEDVPSDCRVCCREVFGPVAVIAPFDDFDRVLEEVNNSIYGLQAGIFTRDIQKAMKAWDTLDVGGVVIGDVPSWRSDEMPYGGVKNSGIGREGVRFAIEDMSELRSLILRKLPA